MNTTTAASVLAAVIVGLSTLLTPVADAATAPATTTKSALYVKTVSTLQSTIDRCDGPAAIRTGITGTPWLLAEHNYCGGKWILSTRKGDLLKIKSGALAGTWRATGRTKIVSRGVSSPAVAGLGSLVAQTCYFGSTKMRLVGFVRR